MVEKNNHNDDTPTRDTGSSEHGVRKRSRLFGGRKSSRRAEAAAAADAVEPSAAARPEPAAAIQHQVAPASNAVPAAVADPHQGGNVQDAVKDSAVNKSAEKYSAEKNSAEKNSADNENVAKESAPHRLPATSILFQAPDIKSFPPREESDRDNHDEEHSGVRRRARRRSGEEGRSGTDDPTNTVVKVRKPRQAPEPITEPQKVKGSTRLEAKKQRRRDGRDAGRRRPVITEAEFLARRESVDRSMVVRSQENRIQIGVLEDGVLVEHYVAKSQEASLIGNVYLGRVQNVLPSMEAAFVDIGRGRNAVLYSGEVDWEAAAEKSSGGSQPRRIELALKPGDTVLVQVTKDPVGHKGARLTSQVSLPGRYLVYVPNGSMNGISRKLPDTERARLKKILKEVLPENVGVIVRTAAEGATEEQLTLDVNRLTAQWADISQRVATTSAPALLHSEPDLLIKIVRDVFNEDFHTLVISGDDARETIQTYLKQVAPDLLDRVETYTGDRDAFDQYRITEQIEKALDRKVWLPSGGSLVMDRTEAMTVIDVNTGKFVGSGGNLEETVTKNNLEAAEEIVRQLRLRDVGGIIVVDFIDMVLESNRDLVLRRLVECLGRDRTKHQVAEVTSLGLIQMTRKKLGLGLLESFSENCEVCAGRGVIVRHDPVTKHKQTQQPERRRGKGSQSNGNGSGAKNGNGSSSSHGTAAVTHAITDDAKNALAQIAASTLVPHQDSEQGAEAPAAEQGAEAPAAEHDAGAPTTAQGRHSRSVKVDENAEPSTAEPADAPEQLQILDIPVVVSPPPAPRMKRQDAEQILDSVLDALPQPKQPGQGRKRSRRVTTAALTGHAVSPDTSTPDTPR